MFKAASGLTRILSRGADASAACTVALGSHANMIKAFSRRVSPAQLTLSTAVGMRASQPTRQIPSDQGSGV